MKRHTAANITISKETKLANRHVSMSNSIVSAAHALTLAEKRIMSAALAQLDSMAKTAPTKAVKVTALEYAECFDIDETTAYEQLKKGADGLFERIIRRLVPTPYGKKLEKIRWIDRALYHPGEGYVEINFSNQVAPYLMALEKRFTTYRLEQTRALRSIHSWRLFENLKRWESTGLWRVSIEDFHHAMESTKSYRENFAQLRKWVIEPAVRELKELSGLEITWEAHKTGRKVSTLLFRFKTADQMSLDLVAPPALVEEEKVHHTTN
jgi:plasmid replication initiation protein